MRIVRDYKYALKTVFVVTMLLVFSRSNVYDQPILFIVSYVDVFLMLFLLVLLCVLVKSLTSSH